MRKVILYIALCLQAITVVAQEETKPESAVEFSLNADIVSRYVWRGLLFSPNANIQPYAGITYGGLSLSTWASYGLSEKYAEVDFILSYNVGNLTVAINDYFNEQEDSLLQNDHFNMKDKTTNHALEASLAYVLSENFPLTITAATYFYGNDRKPNGDQYYSTYLELAYPVTFQNYSFNFFIGGTPGEGLYAEEAAVVNAGFSASKDLKVTDSFSIPISASLVSNPKAEDIFLVFKITF